MLLRDAADYEAAVLEALGLSEATIPWARWSRAYEAISTALTEDRAEVLASGASGNLGDADTRAVAALVFGARSYTIARSVLAAYPPPAGRVAELGAGCGPLGLAAAGLGHRVELHDVSATSLALAPGLYKAAGLPAPACSVGDAAALGGADFVAIGLAFSLNEMLAAGGLDLSRASAWITRWLAALAPGGRLYILEPGTKAQSRLLQTLRDEWRAHVLAPCPQVDQPCPLLEQSRDWCHFTWPHRPGPVTRRLAQLTGRDAGSLRFSWLVLSKEPVQSGRDTPGRLLELRYPDRHKVSAMVCRPDGDVVRLTALRRDPAAYGALTELQPGAVLELELRELESKGDGLRVRGAAGIRPVRPL